MRSRKDELIFRINRFVDPCTCMSLAKLYTLHLKITFEGQMNESFGSALPFSSIELDEENNKRSTLIHAWNFKLRSASLTVCHSLKLLSLVSVSVYSHL